VFLGLGAIVDRERTIPPADRGRLLDALQELKALAEASGAREPILLATEPLRRAIDAEEVAALVEAALGSPLTVLSHAEEGQLSLLGVTGGERPAREMLIVDIGGGSTESILAGPGRPTRVGVVSTGAARLTAMYVRADPPSPDEIGALERAVSAAIERLPKAARLVAIGGTATNLSRMATGATTGRLDTRVLADIRRRLLSEPSAAVATRHGIHPTRARLLPAGMLILQAVLERSGASGVDVSDASLRDGAIVAFAAGGRAWRHRLPELSWASA
jgi:exopolyphosphatase/guanosine-5'-triphosphate,3'-diphosphate pyrophosphatase